MFAQQGLSRDFTKLFRGGSGSDNGDVKLICSRGKKVFQTHRCIIWARCKKFDEMIEKYGEKDKEDDTTLGKYDSSQTILFDFEKALEMEQN